MYNLSWSNYDQSFPLGVNQESRSLNLKQGHLTGRLYSRSLSTLGMTQKEQTNFNPDYYSSIDSQLLDRQWQTVVVGLLSVGESD